MPKRETEPGALCRPTAAGYTAGREATVYYQSERVTLYHGDWRTIPGAALSDVDAVLCDPPYGDNHDTDSRRFTDSPTGKGVTGYSHLRKTHTPIAEDAEPFDPAPLLRYGQQQVFWGYNRFASALPVGSVLVWDKRANNGKALLSDAELAWWSKGRGVYIFEHCWQGFSRASENSKHYHPTQKPVALMRWALGKMNTRAGSLIFDPYAGSAPVGVAAVRDGFRYLGAEVEERYCEIAARRIEAEESQLDLVPAV